MSFRLVRPSALVADDAPESSAMIVFGDTLRSKVR